MKDDDNTIGNLDEDRILFLNRLLGGPDEYSFIAMHVIGVPDDDRREALIAEMLGTLREVHERWSFATAKEVRQQLIADAAEKCAWALFSAKRNIAAHDRPVLEAWIAHHLRNAANHPGEAVALGGDLGVLFIRGGSLTRAEQPRSREGTAEYYEAKRERAREARVEFMNRAVRRGRPFSAKQIAAGLGITEEEAERRKHSGIFSDREVAKIMGITEDEVRYLKCEDPPPALLNVLARYTGYLDRLLWEVWEPNSGLPDGFVGAAASHGRRRVNLKGLHLEEKFRLLESKDEKARRRSGDGEEGQK